MKKVVSVFALVCISTGCYAVDNVDDFMQVATDEYVQHHSESSVFNEEVDIGGFTPTHIFTRKGGTPSDFRDVEKIDYTISGVTFFRDHHKNQCYVDILPPDPSNKYKCRIFGYNGRDVVMGSKSFSVYEVLSEYNSFEEQKSRLIYVTTSGLYIVSESENPLVNVASKYFAGESLKFEGEVIKISAVDGQRTINDQPLSLLHFASSEPTYNQEEGAKKTAVLSLNCKANAKPEFPDRDLSIQVQIFSNSTKSGNSFWDKTVNKAKELWEEIQNKYKSLTAKKNIKPAESKKS